MRNLFILILVLSIISPIAAQTNQSTIEFVTVRLDYQSFALKHIYHYSQSIDMTAVRNSQGRLHGLDFTITPATDFGGTEIYSAYSGQTVYKATTFWMGSGDHVFPTADLEITTGDSTFILGREPEYHDYIDNFFSKTDYARADSAYQIIKDIKLPFQFAKDKLFGALTYLHYFTVGSSDPTTAEWVFIFYSIPGELSPTRYHWENVSGNLPETFINTVATHYFFGDSLWIGTSTGAYYSTSGGNNWEQVHFGENPDVPITVLTTIANPYVDCLYSDCLCSVVGLGTAEKSTSLTKVSGRIFSSFLDGETWEFLNSPAIGVTALAINRWNTNSIYAGLYNPYMMQTGGLYHYDGIGWEKIEYAPQLSNIPTINCITIDDRDSNQVFLGTSQGLFFKKKNNDIWMQRMAGFNISSVIVFYVGDEQVIYLSTNGTGRSDGIWASYDNGETWDVLFWERRIVAFVQDRTQPFYSNREFSRFYMAVYDKGVFESGDECRTWHPITTGLNAGDMKVTSLAVHPSKRGQLYLGTETGIFKYSPRSYPYDLQIANTDLAYWPPKPRDNSLVELYATVHNNSAKAVYNIKISFADNADGVLPVIVPIDTLVIPYIPAMAEHTVRAEWHPKNQAGKNLIFVTVDPDNKLIETDESNNSAQIEVELAANSDKRKWYDISYDLSSAFINDIVSHPFKSKEIYIATRNGAFAGNSNWTGWQQLKFDSLSDVNVTQIEAEAHPYLDWLVPTLWLGTETYSMIPEDRLGKVLMSEDGGGNWTDTNFPPVAVSAIETPAGMAFNTVAASYNPFYYIDNFYVRQENAWKKFDLTPDNTETLHINCIWTSSDNSIILLGTDHGLFVTEDSGQNWDHDFMDFEIVSIIVHQGYREGSTYIATRGRSKSDGIYQRIGGTRGWRIVSYFTDIVSLVSATGLSMAIAPHFYLAIYEDGIYESRAGGQQWEQIADNTINLKATCLETDRQNPEILYLGTEDGIYVFSYPISTGIERHETETKTSMPAEFRLQQNFPNPFNNATTLSYSTPSTMAGEDVSIKIYNSLGQLVWSSVRKNQQPGNHYVTWTGTDNSGNTIHSGVYLCRVKCGRYSRSIKAVLLK